MPEHLVVQGKDLIDIEVDVDISEPIKHYAKEEFKTDSDISNNRDKVKSFEERELVKWEPEEEEGLQKLTLEDEATSKMATHIGINLRLMKKSLVLRVLMMNICILQELTSQPRTMSNVLLEPIRLLLRSKDR